MIEKKKKWKLADFDYPLPEKYIAQYPAKRRDQSKLMVIHKDTGDIEHRTFSNLPEYMKKNDLLITNNTKVFPARLYANKDRTEAKVEVFLLRELENDLWEVMVRPARKVRIGNKLVFTKVDCEIEGDVYYPDVNLDEWVEKSSRYFSKDSENDYDFVVKEYERY